VGWAAKSDRLRRIFSVIAIPVTGILRGFGRFDDLDRRRVAKEFTCLRRMIRRLRPVVGVAAQEFPGPGAVIKMEKVFILGIAPLLAARKIPI